MDQKRRYQNGFYSPIIYGQCTPTKMELFLENAHIHRMMIQDHQKQNRNRKTNKTKRTPFSFCCQLFFVCAICMDEHHRIANIQQQQQKLCQEDLGLFVCWPDARQHTLPESFHYIDHDDEQKIFEFIFTHQIRRETRIKKRFETIGFFLFSG